MLGIAHSKQHECPRCLGKGLVDEHDIARLGRFLDWNPGVCALCGGSGKVDSKTLQNLPAGLPYLTDDLPDEERRLLIQGDDEAWDRARDYEEDNLLFRKEVRFLAQAGLSVGQLAAFFLLEIEGEPDYEDERDLLIPYIEKVLAYPQIP